MGHGWLLYLSKVAVAVNSYGPLQQQIIPAFIFSYNTCCFEPKSLRLSSLYTLCTLQRLTEQQRKRSLLDISAQSVKHKHSSTITLSDDMAGSVSQNTILLQFQPLLQLLDTNNFSPLQFCYYLISTRIINYPYLRKIKRYDSSCFLFCDITLYSIPDYLPRRPCKQITSSYCRGRLSCSSDWFQPLSRSHMVLAFKLSQIQHLVP